MEFFPTPDPDAVLKLLKRICNALYVCGSCGITTQGGNIRIDAGAPLLIEYPIKLASFGCKCGGRLEPVEFSD